MKYEKLSANMASVIEEIRSPAPVANVGTPRAVPMADTGPGQPPALFVHIRCAPGAQLDAVPGVTMLKRDGAVRTALVTIQGVDALSERDDVRRIAPSVQLKPLNDIAATKTNLAAFRAPANLTGNNVVVGVVDSGIDVSHQAFGNRIHSIWDQTIAGTGWGTTNYGSVLSGAALVASVDTNGHGTHVAGTAAGDDATFGGVAPAATIVVVKTNFLNTGISDGIRYVFFVAEQLGLPAVVNLSLGGHFDAHDGSDDLSEVIGETTGPGRIVVAAAGNEGDAAIHGAVTVQPGTTRDLAFTVVPTTEPGATPWVLLNGWYDGNGDCEISVQTSGGDSTPFQPVFASGPTSRTHTFTHAVVRLTTPPATATPNGDTQFLAELFPAPFSNFVQGGTWRLRVRNNGATAVRLDVWSLVPQGARDAVFTGASNSPDMKIGSPGSAAEAITVAAYTTRNTWIDTSGMTRVVGMAVDTLSDFSSPGPLRTGAQKPDVAAPGAMIVSCRSSSAVTNPRTIVATGFRVEAGTSMACPFVAGLVALLLERDNTLDTQQIKALLRSQSAIPGQAAGAFDNRWGFGLIDAGGL